MHVKRIIKEYYVNSASPFNNLDETDQFTERHKVPKLTQGEINNLNRTTSIKDKLSQYLIMFQEKKN